MSFEHLIYGAVIEATNELKNIYCEVYNRDCPNCPAYNDPGCTIALIGTKVKKQETNK